ncbi:hypothetical protein [Streptomyces sp. NPDC089915]|uniref:hypothetical protein n=1 Tax=Streptomyces sp. NPDC089915 TaxID=3155186 RepID=UPI0034454BC7
MNISQTVDGRDSSSSSDDLDLHSFSARHSGATEGGRREGKPLIESEPPERESAKAQDLESAEEIETRKSLIESETKKNESPEESPRG